MTVTETPTLSAGTWAIEPAHSEVGFTVRHLGLSKVRGRFNRFRGSVEVHSDLRTASLEATIDLSSVDTNHPERDGHLRSGDFFDATTRPEMRFVSTEATENVLIGDLTIGDITRPVELDVEFHGVTVDGYSTTRAGFSARGVIRRSDWGIDFNAPLGADGMLVSDKVSVELEIQLVPEPV